MRGSAANFVPRGKHSDCVLRTKQGAVVGCVAEPLPAAETGEAEQGQRRRPRPVDEAGSRRWRSGLNMQASSLMRRIFRAPQEERRPNMQAGGDPRCIFGQRQPGAALRFLQAGSVPRRKNRLSARGFHTVPATARGLVDALPSVSPRDSSFTLALRASTHFPAPVSGVFLCPGGGLRPAAAPQPR